MDYIEEFKKLRTEKKLLREQKKDQNYTNVKNKIISLENKIMIASNFDIESISKVLIDLINIYDGKRFVLSNIFYIDDELNCYIDGEVKALINVDKVENMSRLSHLNILQKEGNLIALDWHKSSKNISFYCRNICKNHDLINNIKLNKFPYLKNFIDFVISYKIENNKIDLTKEELEDLKNKFVYDNVDEIQQYHDIVYFEAEKKYEKELENNAKHRDKILERTLRKYNKNK